MGEQSLPLCFGDLAGVTLDADDVPAQGHRDPRHRAAELPEAAPHVKNPFAAPQPKLAQRRFVDERIQCRQPSLLGFIGTVDVM